MTSDTTNNGNGRVTGLERDVAWIKDSLQRIEHGQTAFLAAFEEHKSDDAQKHARLDEFRASVSTWGKVGAAAAAFLQAVTLWWIGKSQ